MKRKHLILSVLADVLAVFGLIAIVAGIAVAGYIPHAICAAGVELVAVGVTTALVLRGDGE